VKDFNIHSIVLDVIGDVLAVRRIAGFPHEVTFAALGADAAACSRVQGAIERLVAGMPGVRSEIVLTPATTIGAAVFSVRGSNTSKHQK
jgi:hypothetical protein